MAGFGYDDAIMLALAGMSMIGGGDQELTGFRGKGIDPRDVLQKGLSQNDEWLNLTKGRAKQDITLPGAYAQQPPVFTGGGLPMPIGVTGVDPALSNPGAHLRQPGPANQPSTPKDQKASAGAAAEANAALELLMDSTGTWRPGD